MAASQKVLLSQNSTNPKVRGAKLPGEFRPIALLNGRYKVLDAMVKDRMVEILDK